MKFECNFSIMTKIGRIFSLFSLYHFVFHNCILNKYDDDEIVKMKRWSLKKIKIINYERTE